MVAAVFRFHADLDFFLDRLYRDGEVLHTFEPHQSLKHLIESLGVPHVEIGRLLVNGAPAQLNARLNDGDEIDVYAVTPYTEVDLRFVLDNHLGRLAVYLRMLGFDTLYRNDYADPELANAADSEDRILISRDRRLLMHNAVRRGFCPRSLIPEEQLNETARRYGITQDRRRVSRCLLCNETLVPVKKEEVVDRIEPLTKLYYHEFSLCPLCSRIYWKGTHWERMERIISKSVINPGQE